MHKGIHCTNGTKPFFVSNTLRLRQNGCHFADDIFKWIFLNENVWISSNFWLKFVPRNQINNKLALVQIMAWRRRPGDKPLSDQWCLDYRCMYVSLGLNGFRLYIRNWLIYLNNENTRKKLPWNFNENTNVSLWKMHVEMSSTKCYSFCFWPKLLMHQLLSSPLV